MPVYAIPNVDPKLWQGRRNLVFQGTGLGRGVPRYARAPGFPTGSEKPIAVGARMYLPDPDYDEEDVRVPDAVGSKYEGGKPAYQQEVYNAAKKVGKERGMKTSEIDALKPRVVA